jgi:hypothetical protein
MSELRRNAVLAGSKYTIEAMVENYRSGINQCLERTKTTSRIPHKMPSYRENKIDA